MHRLLVFNCWTLSYRTHVYLENRAVLSEKKHLWCMVFISLASGHTISLCRYLNSFVLMHLARDFAKKTI